MGFVGRFFEYNSSFCSPRVFIYLISFMLLLYFYDLMYIFWGEKEYLKLYSYLLLDYPVVVHLDLDTLVLKPMDDVFDIMTDPLYNRIKFKHHSMWKEEEGRNGLVDFVFTRDYNMVRFFGSRNIFSTFPSHAASVYS